MTTRKGFLASSLAAGASAMLGGCRMFRDAEIGKLPACGRVEGVKRPVGRDVADAERTEKTERREVCRLPFVHAEVHHVLDGGTERAEVALVREDGQREADARHGRARFLEVRAQLGATCGKRVFRLLAARVADGEDDFIERGEILRKGLVEAKLEDLEVERVRGVVGAAQFVQDAGDVVAPDGFALRVELGDQLAAKVVEKRGGGEEVRGIVDRKRAERPVRVAEARKGHERVEQRDEQKGDILAACVFADGRGFRFLLSVFFSAALLFVLRLFLRLARQGAAAELGEEKIERGDEQRGQKKDRTRR